MGRGNASDGYSAHQPQVSDGMVPLLAALWLGDSEDTLMFRGCFNCGTLERDVLHCPDCQANFCAESECQTVHGWVHADVMWHKNLDENLERIILETKQRVRKKL